MPIRALSICFPVEAPSVHAIITVHDDFSFYENGTVIETEEEMTATGERDGRTYHYDTDKEAWLWDDNGEAVPKGGETEDVLVEKPIEGLMKEYSVKTVQQHMVGAGCGGKTIDWMHEELKLGWLLESLVCITVDATPQDDPGDMQDGEKEVEEG